MNRGRPWAAWAAALLPLLTVFGCRSIPTAAERGDSAVSLLHAAGLHPVTLRAGTFDLFAGLPASNTLEGPLTVYLEGDGLAWRSGSRPSDDPTPVHPVALEMAAAHAVTDAPAAPVAYLARPCQYTGARSARGCNVRYWTESRFADEVIVSTGLALDEIKHRLGANEVVLVGFSGGAAVAALLAARRADIVGLVTVAGNLDPGAWTAHHRVTPLDGSLDPVAFSPRLRDLPQVHFVGSDDRVVPPMLVRGFTARLDGRVSPSVVEVPGFDHHCCWARDWPRLQRQATTSIEQQVAASRPSEFFR